MVMTIYGDLRSGNCLKVKWTAEKLKLPYRWIEIDVVAGQARQPEITSINPAAQVPTVVFDDGRTLAQSNAIMVYLAEGTTLVSEDSFQRARMLEWLFWEQNSHEPYIAVARFQIAFLGKRRETLEPRLFERGEAALRRLEAALGGSPFLVGERLSLADIAVVAYTRVAPEGGFDLQPYPAVRQWIARVEDELELGGAS